jgi:hypothetical protein
MLAQQGHGEDTSTQGLPEAKAAVKLNAQHCVFGYEHDNSTVTSACIMAAKDGKAKLATSQTLLVGDSTVGQRSIYIIQFMLKVNATASLAVHGRGGCPISGKHNYWGCPECIPPSGSPEVICSNSLRNCRRMADVLLGSDISFRNIIVSNHWKQYLAQPDQLQLLLAALGKLQKASSAKGGLLFIIGDAPEHRGVSACPAKLNPDDLRSMIEKRCFATFVPEKETWKINSFLKLFASRHENVFYFDELQSLCWGGSCRLYSRTGHRLYVDSVHLSAEGALHIFDAEMSQRGIPVGLEDIFR